MRRMNSYLIITAIAICANSSLAAEHLTYEDMLDHLTNLDRLPVIEPGVTSGQFSSYDRLSRYDAEKDEYIEWSANNDRGQYIRRETNGEGVMAEMDGPGCIFRIWSANPQGVIRFYLDGDAEPTYEFDFRALCAGEIDPFIEPLVWKRPPKDKVGTASNCYVPIPFNKSCKVTALGQDRKGKPAPPLQYYIINYRSFPKDWTVDTFKLPLSQEQREALKTTAAIWANAGIRKCGTVVGNTPTREARIKAGDEHAFMQFTGPATDSTRVVTLFHLKINSPDPWASRKNLIRIYFDDEKTPSVDAPVGDFFGDPYQTDYKSYPMGFVDGMGYCYFPMPFKTSAKFCILNESQHDMVIHSRFCTQSMDLGDNWGYFKAKWRTELESTSFDYPLIQATGTGKLVGITLYPHNHAGGWWGEGDEKVYVDGEKFPSWFGTGSEDYFGDAWGMRTFHQPSHGFPQQRDGSRDRELFACYRWHLADNIPFYKSFYMTIENYAGKEGAPTQNDYSSVAYWYQLPGGTDFFQPTPVEERIPPAFVAQNVSEVEKAATSDNLKSGMSIVNDDDLPKPLSRRYGLKLVGQVGDTFDVPFNVKRSDVYTLRLHRAQDAKASAYELLRDSKPLEKKVPLLAGPNTVTVRFTGEPVEGDRCELIVDYVKLEEYKNLIKEWALIGPFPTDKDRTGFDAVYPPEEELKSDAIYEGRNGQQIRWTTVRRDNGKIELDHWLEPSDYYVLYAACVVHSPRDLKTTLHLGSDDGVKAWLNGQLVHTNKTSRPLWIDVDHAEVELKKGENILLLKVEQLSGGAGFAARFSDPHQVLEFKVPR